MPVLITTPFPTLEETAAAYGLPIEEARKIEKMALEAVARRAKRAAAKKSRARAAKQARKNK